MNTADRLAAIRARVDATARSAGRDPRSVELLAVSKLQPPAQIREAYAAGHRAFGENYAQELRDKAVALADLPGLMWHAIGALQRNKIQYVARVATAFHALDGLELAEALSARRVDHPLGPLDVYLEVNVADAPTKHGIPASLAPAMVDRVRTLPGLRVRGLMCMPPLDLESPEQSRPWFAALRALAARCDLSGLSMGTTGDFEVAIEEGATIVRVGRSIFGERPAPA